MSITKPKPFSTCLLDVHTVTHKKPSGVETNTIKPKNESVPTSTKSRNIMIDCVRLNAKWKLADL